MQTKEGASTCVRAKFGEISAVAALLWDHKPSAGGLSTLSPPSAALAACLCCCGDVPRVLVFFLTYYNCCWILQVAASKRRAAPIYLWTGLVLLLIISRVTVAAGSMPRFHLVELCVLCAVCYSVCFKYLGFPTQKLCVFCSVFTVQIRGPANPISLARTCAKFSSGDHAACKVEF